MDLFRKVKTDKRWLILPLLFIVLSSYLYLPWHVSYTTVPVNHNTSNKPNATIASDKAGFHYQKSKINLTSLQPLLQNGSIPPNKKSATGHPVILVWNFVRDPLGPRGILGGFNTSSCEHVCEYTKDRKQFQTSDAVIFHGSTFRINDTPMSLNMSRPPGQIWIYNNVEAPIYVLWKNMSPSFAASFNWTMTYRKDADIYFPYGYISIIPPISGALWDELENKRKSALMKKNKLVVWAVSHCHTKSRREDLVKSLQRYIPIDIVGSCGDRRYCPRVASDYDTCFAKFEANYKFYLSFENSICKDYVTEKFFNPMNHDIVPIVYGGADLDWLGAPKESYIDIQDFNSSQHLAEYLMDLDRDEEKYAKYFEYKRNHQVQSGSKASWCKLCEMLYKQRELSFSQWYPDIKQWYENEYHDRAPTGAKMCVERGQIRFN